MVWKEPKCHRFTPKSDDPPHEIQKIRLKMLGSPKILQIHPKNVEKTPQIQPQNAERPSKSSAYTPKMLGDSQNPPHSPQNLRTPPPKCRRHTPKILRIRLKIPMDPKIPNFHPEILRDSPKSAGFTPKFWDNPKILGDFWRFGPKWADPKTWWIDPKITTTPICRGTPKSSEFIPKCRGTPKSSKSTPKCRGPPEILQMRPKNLGGTPNPFN